MYQAINNPVNYGGLELKNRIIFAPTTFGLSDEEYFEKIIFNVFLDVDYKIYLKNMGEIYGRI